MKQRIGTSIGIVILLIVAFVTKIWTPYVFDAIFLILSVVAVYEVAKVLDHAERQSNIVLAMLFPIAIFGGLIYGFLSDWIWQSYLYLYLLTMLSLCLVSFIVGMLRPKGDIESKFRASFDLSMNTIFLCFYPSILLSAMIIINHFNDLVMSSIVINSNFNIFILLLVFTITILTDTMAMLCGKTFKGPKLCPKISPKKTISGALFGVVFGITGAVLLYLIFRTSDAFIAASDYLKLNVYWMILIGGVGSVLSQMGDIFASYIKRKSDVKDYGHVLPGHGGVMDRIDGLLFNAIWILCIIFAFI